MQAGTHTQTAVTVSDYTTNRAETDDVQYIGTKSDVYPRALTEQNTWIVWEEVERDGDTTKMPRRPRTRKPTGVDSPEDWVSFETAKKAVEENGWADGLGFVFTKNDPFVGIDLDHVIEDDGTVEDWAWQLVEDVSSYTEVSPSGDGLHIIANADLDDEYQNRDNELGLEMYDSKRFFTVTGESIVHAEERIVDRTDEVRAVQQRLLEPSPPRGHCCAEAVADWDVSEATSEPTGTDEQIVDWMSTWNDKFDTLHRGGSVHPSDSEDDIAYLNQIAWATKKNATQMERIARSSRRVRPKWDEPRNGTTWLREQIQEAISFTDNVCNKTFN